MEGRDKRYGAFLRTELRRVREEGGRALAALYGLALLTRTKSMDGERLWRSQPGFIAMPPTEPFQAACYREQTGLCATECLGAKQGWTHRGGAAAEWPFLSQQQTNGCERKGKLRLGWLRQGGKKEPWETFDT